MKRLFFVILILLLASQSWAAAKFNAMTGATDFIEIVDDATDITVPCSTGEILKKGASDWECAVDSTAAGGQAVILDLADDGTNESTDIGEIAVTNDTGSVFTEPAADKLLIDGTNLLYESELDTESELEAQITDMANIIQATEIDTFAEVDALVADKTLVNTADGATWTGTHDFGGATLEVPNTVVGSLPAATLGRLAIVTDGASDADCTTGGGSTVVSCMANGSTWEPTGDSGTGGGGTPGGSDGQVQYNNGGSFGGENELFYDDVNNRLGVGTSTPAYTLDVTGGGQFTGALIVGSTLGVTEQVTMTKGVIVNNGRDTTTSGDFLVQGGGITDLIFADASANDVIFDGDVVLTQGTSCADTTEGSICWDTDDDTLNVGNGATVTTIGGGGSGDITDVFNCSTGDCAAIVMGASDSLDGGAGTIEIPNSTTLPATCTVGEIYMDTDATSGQRIYACESTNTWALQGDGGGAGGGQTEVRFQIQSAKVTGAFVTDGDATQGALVSASDGGWRLLFDATTDEAAVWQFRMPANYSSAPVLKVQYSMDTATSGTVEFEGAIMCVSDGDAADIGTASFSTIAVASATVPGTAGYLDEVSITLTDDSCAAGDAVWVYLSTDSDDVTNDTATGDREVVNAVLTYTGS